MSAQGHEATTAPAPILDDSEVWQLLLEQEMQAIAKRQQQQRQPEQQNSGQQTAQQEEEEDEEQAISMLRMTMMQTPPPPPPSQLAQHSKPYEVQTWSGIAGNINNMSSPQQNDNGIADMVPPSLSFMANGASHDRVPSMSLSSTQGGGGGGINNSANMWVDPSHDISGPTPPVDEAAFQELFSYMMGNLNNATMPTPPSSIMGDMSATLQQFAQQQQQQLQQQHVTKTTTTTSSVSSNNSKNNNIKTSTNRNATRSSSQPHKGDIAWVAQQLGPDGVDLIIRLFK